MTATRTRATLSTARRLAWPWIDEDADRVATDRTAVAGGASADDAADGADVDRDASPIVLVPLRLFVGVIWLRAGAEKVVDPAWWDASGVEAFVTTQVTSGSVAAEWCVWLARTVVLPNAQAVAWVVMVLQILTGLGILLGVATASFLVVGIAMNVSFLLMGAVNPSAFYIPMQVTLLMGDAGSVAGLGRALEADHGGRLRRWHAAVVTNQRGWRLAAGLLAVFAALAILHIERFVPADVVGDPFAVLALLAGLGALGALIHAAGHGPDGRWRATAVWTTRAPRQTADRTSTPRQPHRAGPDDTLGDRGDTRSPAADEGVRPAGRSASGHTTANVPSSRRSRRQTTRGLRIPPCQRDLSGGPPPKSPATTVADVAVRAYMAAIRDPGALRDEHAIAEVQTRIDRTEDGLARLRLRQRLLDLQQPSLTPYEEAFVAHAKAWADTAGVSGEAFALEGVAVAVLRRAGFRVVADGGRRRSRARSTGSRRTARRRATVTADEVRAAIPSGTFTVTTLQQLSGASTTTVRRVVREGVEAGRLIERGGTSDHSGPGRAPTIYERS